MRRIGVYFTLVVVTGALCFGGWTIYDVNQSLRNSYAVWWVADMIIEHMEANSGVWPNDWNDLLDDYQTCVQRSGKPWTFDKLRSWVQIDWNVDANRLAEIAQQPTARTVRVIWLSDGTNAHWENREPNSLIKEYLVDRNSRFPKEP